MRYTSQAIEVLIEEFAKLPGVGKKTAQRLALHILREKKEDVERFAKALLDAKEKVVYCSECQNMTDLAVNPCVICQSPKRNHSLVCVVESPSDVIAFEKTNQYSGLYHVLHGVISPLDGVGPDDLKIKELIARLATEKGQKVKEIILALNPTIEGETTVLYLTKLLKPLGLKITRIARGVPIGSELEYADEATLTRALEGRTEAS
ncbi:MAG: recombination mediator RecR [Chloroherpetonaceae bacterium]|nr:recombination mediator RecR [Chloroherpetonaceae bacterium]MDW8437790.1 recombination mediator RecR [Chloroherpetonaceae bacterium]